MVIIKSVAQDVSRITGVHNKLVELKERDVPALRQARKRPGPVIPPPKSTRNYIPTRSGLNYVKWRILSSEMQTDVEDPNLPPRLLSPTA